MGSKLLFLVLALLAVASAAPETRIVGGTPTTIENFPYIVSYTYFYPGPGIYVQRCVGSLISSWHVLTTAYCFTEADLDHMTVRAGSTNSLSGGVVSTIQNVIKHPDYVAAPRAADIAVTVLATPFGITDSIDVLFLPAEGWYIADGSPLKIVSWGFESESGPQLETLKTITLFKQPIDECKAIYGDNSDVVISDPVICASQPGYGVCTGDSGAPMVIDTVVVGLSSFHQNCADDDYPDVFTRIDRYTNWILEVAVPQKSGSTRIGENGRLIDMPVAR